MSDVEKRETGGTVDVCEECNYALASAETWFNGRTLMRLCVPCWEWWKAHGLIEPKAQSGRPK